MLRHVGERCYGSKVCSSGTHTMAANSNLWRTDTYELDYASPHVCVLLKVLSCVFVQKRAFWAKGA
eukprot:44013-Amphidinium_carterae.1